MTSPEIIYYFSCSTQLSMLLIMHINVEMPKELVSILRFYHDKYNHYENIFILALYLIRAVEISSSIELSMKIV